ncbi:MAG TPA: type II secretion system F family protein [Moorella mulderi]|nr:type II secretion system F family protein [Moorella mulderi]
MPLFVYEGVGPGGRRLKGVLEGEDPGEVASRLRRRGIMVTSLEEKDERRGAALGTGDLLARITPVRQGEVVLCLRQMGSLIKAGVPVVTTLRTLEEEMPNPRLRHTLRLIREEVERGVPLSRAMARFPRIFPAMVTSLVEAGEITGLMDVALERVTAYWEERLALARQVISSSLYPALVFLASIGVAVFLIVYVIPKLVPFLTSMGGELPPQTKLLVALGEKGPRYLPSIGKGVLLFLGCLILGFRIPQTRYYLDLIRLHLPLLGPVFRHALVVHFAKTMGLLVGSGIPIVEAIKATQGTIGYLPVCQALEEVHRRVLRGETLSQLLSRFRYFFPPMAASILRVGEEGGTLEGALLMVGDTYDQMLRDSIQRLMTMIEPLLLVFMRGMVAFVAASLIGAILAAYSTLGG